MKEEEEISPLVESLQQEKKQILSRLGESDARLHILEAELDDREARTSKDRYLICISELMEDTNNYNRRDTEELRNECGRLARKTRSLEAHIEDLERAPPNTSSSPLRPSSGMSWNRMFEDYQALQGQVCHLLYSSFYYY